MSDIIMAVIFFLFAGLQYNDPDPLSWMSLYGLCTVCCLLGFSQKNVWFISAIVASLALLWAVVLFSELLAIPDPIEWKEIFGTLGMTSLLSEIIKEICGLIIAAAWMGWLSWRAWLLLKRA